MNKRLTLDIRYFILKMSEVDPIELVEYVEIYSDLVLNNYLPIKIVIRTKTTSSYFSCDLWRDYLPLSNLPSPIHIIYL